jgi:hypothetical protein
MIPNRKRSEEWLPKRNRTGEAYRFPLNTNIISI